MPTAHVIHGYIGAGKMSFARRPKQELLAIASVMTNGWPTFMAMILPSISFRHQVSRLIGKQWTDACAW